jgi:hypothetical protein
MRHFNTSISEDKTRILNLKGQQDTAEVLDYITPVVLITENVDVVEMSQIANLNGNSNILTTPLDKDFYIQSVQLSRTKDATADTSTSSLNATIKGVAKRLINMSGITLTASSNDIFLTFPRAIKIDRGTSILINSSRTVGSTYHSASITGYTRETLKGV